MEPSTDRLAQLVERLESKQLLRFITCGSVDDGKSTLIGRLLHDSQKVLVDHLEAARNDSKRWGTTGGELDLALLVDGLQAEREQGITIDVAYRYFDTDRRKFIIADTPGHEQYTRNMATGASTADLAIILVDATRGVQAQTRRHAVIASLMGIRHIVVAINKIDLCDFSKDVAATIENTLAPFLERLGPLQVHYIPLSALQGDNVVMRSENTPWYQGPPLLELLETIDAAPHRFGSLRFPVQFVLRPNASFRGFAGTIAAGVASVGDPVVVLPSGRTSTISAIGGLSRGRDRADSGAAVTLRLADEVDVSRGDLLVSPNNAPELSDQCEAQVVWMSSSPLSAGKTYDIKIGTRTLRGTIERIVHRLDVHDLTHAPATELVMNDIALCRLSFEERIPLEPYDVCRATGSFIFIDRKTHETAGAGMIRRVLDRTISATNPALFATSTRVSSQDRARQKAQQPCILWFTGLSGSGKSTIASALDHALFQRGHHSYVLDGDNVRLGLNKNLDFSEAGRIENIRRTGEVAKLFIDAGLIVIAAFISPFQSDRQRVRALVQPGEFVEVYVSTPLEVCEHRDPKGLYRKARLGEIGNFTGVSSPYEAPGSAEIVLDTSEQTLDASVSQILRYLTERKMLGK